MVFSLVGMGGVGKITLAKKVFDIEKEKFDCHAWITVSQTYSMKELYKSLIQQFHQACKESFPTGMKNMDESMLINHLHEFVKEKRYVVAFDDIWDAKLWMDMKYALPDNKNSSRIIITTRKENDAPSSVESLLYCVYQLQPLPFEEAWKLFCKKVFCSPVNEAQDCPPELKELSESMVRKCEGLPLAIVAIGGLLSTKQKDVFEWKKIHDSLITELENNENLESVTKVLSLSYHDLPYYLKPCLLYFGMFPEDYSIRGSRLTRQWNAEGFIKSNGQEIIEDVAEDYLMELFRRNLIQVSKVDYSGKGIKYRVHDLIREIIHSKSEEQRFGQILIEMISNNMVGDQSRRLSIVNNTMDTFPENVKALPIRSFSVFQVLEFSNNYTISLFKNFKLLNMLDFEDAPLTSLPDEVGNLFHLKYLSIRNTKVEHLPSSIGKLQMLETLDMKRSLVRQLPVEIKRLRKLRHLLVQGGISHSPSGFGAKIVQGLGCQEMLQKLSYVEANGVIKELKNFMQLRRLGITDVTAEDETELCCAIENMKQLRSLKISARKEHRVLDHERPLNLESIVSPPPLLRRLILGGRLTTLPNWISSLHNLATIRLWCCGLTNDDTLQVLQDLPNLVDLQLYNDAYIGEVMRFQEGGFKKLKVLHLFGLRVLKKLIIEEGAMSNLEQLYLGPCPRLTEVPFGIQYLRKLERVCFSEIPRELYMSMAAEPVEGPNYKLIRHIPKAYLAIKSGPREYKHYILK